MSDTTARDTTALEADIARQRAELAGTVQDLQDRLDVKARAQEKAQHKAQDIKERPQVLAIGTGVALALAALVVWRRWKETT